jgi:hypothetical protein
MPHQRRHRDNHNDWGTSRTVLGLDESLIARPCRACTVVTVRTELVDFTHAVNPVQDSAAILWNLLWPTLLVAAAPRLHRHAGELNAKWRRR